MGLSLHCHEFDLIRVTILLHFGSVVGSSPSSNMVQNYKQMSGDCSPTNTEELLTPAHEENVRFIHYSKLLHKNLRNLFKWQRGKNNQWPIKKKLFVSDVYRLGIRVLDNNSTSSNSLAASNERHADLPGK